MKKQLLAMLLVVAVLLSIFGLMFAGYQLSDSPIDEQTTQTTGKNTSSDLITQDTRTTDSTESTAKPTTEPMTAPTEPSTTAPTEPSTTAPTEPSTTATTEPPTTAPTEPSTTAPTEPSTTAPTEPSTTAPTEPALVLDASHAFVYDVATGEFLYTKGDLQQSISPASITKLFTAYVTLQILPLEQVIQVGEEILLIDPRSSVADLAVGDQLTVEQLVAGMLLPSGNDAAYTLAVAAGRTLAEDPKLEVKSAIALFMDAVNRCGAEQQFVNTYFLTPDGNDYGDHHTCLADLVTMMLLVMENSTIRYYSGVEKLTVTAPDGKQFTWESSNLLLHQNNPYFHGDVVGGKTGSTSLAGKCLLTLFEQDGRQLMICVMGCTANKLRYEDTLLLYTLYA